MASMADEPGEAPHFPLRRSTIIHNLSEGVQVQPVFALKVLALAEFFGGKNMTSPWLNDQKF